MWSSSLTPFAVSSSWITWKPPNSLDAWEAHHRGLWRVYLFTQADNAPRAAVLRDGGAARPDVFAPYAGFVPPFQSAFQGWAPRNRRNGSRLRRRRAQRDGGRTRPRGALGDGARAVAARAPSGSVGELERSIDLSPNFAMGHYSLAFIHSQAGDPRAATVVGLRAPAQSVRSAALRHAGVARDGAAPPRPVRGGGGLGRQSGGARERASAHPRDRSVWPGVGRVGGRGARLFAAIRKGRPQYAVADFLDAFRLDADGVEWAATPPRALRRRPAGGNMERSPEGTDMGANLNTVEARALVPTGAWDRRTAAAGDRLHNGWATPRWRSFRRGLQLPAEKFYVPDHTNNFVMSLLVEDVDAWWGHVSPP